MTADEILRAHERWHREDHRRGMDFDEFYGYDGEMETDLRAEILGAIGFACQQEGIPRVDVLFDMFERACVVPEPDATPAMIVATIAGDHRDLLREVLWRHKGHMAERMNLVETALRELPRVV